MCCLFGFTDYNQSLTLNQKQILTALLAVESEERGTDATGIAYNGSHRLTVYKQPLSARKMRFRLPREACTIMGHTRMTTQGNEKHNFNNHPFLGTANGLHFALAHNGVLYNDEDLKETLRLPKTKIETDSYVAVQLLEKLGELSFSNIGKMAESLKGTFTLTVLDSRNNLYFVKGNNPLCLYHYPKYGIYVYASTQKILESAVNKFPLNLGKPESIQLNSGDILRINRHGDCELNNFDSSNIEYSPPWSRWIYPAWDGELATPSGYIKELKEIAGGFGYSADDVDELLAEGLSPEEIEEYFYYAVR